MSFTLVSGSRRLTVNQASNMTSNGTRFFNDAVLKEQWTIVF